MTCRTIPLSRGYEALVDDVDYDALAMLSWSAYETGGGKVYAARTAEKANGRPSTEYMHRRIIVGASRIDHINGDGLDNRRLNLRAATHAENLRNRVGLTSFNTSGYRGVYLDKRDRRWQAAIWVNGRAKSLGRYGEPEDAARAFDAAALKYFGEFHGYLNFPNEHELEVA